MDDSQKSLAIDIDPMKRLSAPMIPTVKAKDQDAGPDGNEEETTFLTNIIESNYVNT